MPAFVSYAILITTLQAVFRHRLGKRPVTRIEQCYGTWLTWKWYSNDRNKINSTVCKEFTTVYVSSSYTRLILLSLYTIDTLQRLPEMQMTTLAVSDCLDLKKRNCTVSGVQYLLWCWCCLTEQPPTCIIKHHKAAWLSQISVTEDSNFTWTQLKPTQCLSTVTNRTARPPVVYTGRCSGAWY